MCCSNINEIIKYIDNLYVDRLKIKPTLYYIRKFIKLYDVTKNMNVIHVAGTNGKGSVCNMIAKIFEMSGYKVGLFTSPHIVKINERIKINSVAISNKDFCYYALTVKKAMENNSIKLSYFEFITIIALMYFNKQKCDIVVLEAGLGGEFDATNIFKKPLLTVITNIGLDHENVLGNGIKNIALSKAGIFKYKVPAVLYDIKVGKQIFIKKALEKKVDLHIVDFNNIKIKDSKKVNKEFSYKDFENIKLNLCGEYQVKNAVVALEAVSILKSKYSKINISNIRNALKCVDWKARFEIITKTKPMIILDGGHNIQCIDCIVDELHKLNNDNIVFLVSTVKDKKTVDIAKKLSTISNKVVLYEMKNKRSNDIITLSKIFRRYFENIFYDNNLRTCIDIAKKEATKKGIVCIIGSFFLVGEVIKYKLY